MLSSLLFLGATTLGLKKANDYVTSNRTINKRVNLMIGASYCDLDIRMKRQILDFCSDEIIHAVFEGKKECRLHFDQLGLYELFDLGFKNEILDLFSSVQSNMFKEVHIYSNHIKFIIADSLIESVFLFFETSQNIHNNGLLYRNVSHKT